MWCACDVHVMCLMVGPVHTVLPGQPRSDLLSEWRRKALEKFYRMEGGEEGGELRADRGLSCVGVACVRVLEGRWREAKVLAERGEWDKL